MMDRKQSIQVWIARGIALYCLAATSPAQAQIAADRTLSTNIKTTDNFNFTITNGNRAGSNLFHSFREFSVPTGGSAIFNNAPDIQNIFSRVTGTSVSTIDGLLQAKGTANLFLLNPNGVIFGPNASLDVGGSFLASTASNLTFADGTQFSATAPQTTPLLTVSVPIGLQFREASRSIVNRSRSTVLAPDGKPVIGGLQVAPGKTLALVGGDVSLNGGSLQAPGGHVSLEGVTGPGTVGLSIAGSKLSLNFPETIGRADVSLRNEAFVNVAAGGGGSIAINAQNLDVLQGSRLSAGIASELGSVDAQAGDITLNATGTITVDGLGSNQLTSGILNTVEEKAKGKAGNINVTTKSLSVTNRAKLDASTSGQGNAGNVTINADTVSFGRDSAALSSVNRKAEGNAGNIDITAGSLSVTDGAILFANSRSRGDAGNVTINAETVSFEGVGTLKEEGRERSSKVNVRVGPDGTGNAGSINIMAKSLLVSDGAQLLAGTRGLGNAGSVTINAKTISLEGVGRNGVSSGAFSIVGEKAKGKGGIVHISAETLLVSGGARLGVSTFGQGDAGNVTIEAETITLKGTGSNGRSSGIASNVMRSKARGKGGSINIRTGSLSVTEGARITTTTSGKGDAGNVTIEAETVSLQGVGSNGGSSGVRSFVGSEAEGNGGSINITAGSLSVTDGALVTAFTDSQESGGDITINAKTFEALRGGQVTTSSRLGSGDAGDINLNVTDSVTLAGSDPTYAARLAKYGQRVVLNVGPKSGLFANTASGNGGDITLRDSNLWLMRDGSQISTTAGTEGGSGNGGNITIDTDLLVALNNSDITANAFEGQGGNITINTQGVFRSGDSDITASSELGIDGIVDINTPDVDSSRGLVTLPEEIVDVTGLIAQGCAASGSSAGQEKGKFYVTGRGGLLPTPRETVSSDTILEDWGIDTRAKDRSTSVSSQPSLKSPPTASLPAKGWVINDKGEVTLTAQVATPATCHTR